MKTTTFFYSVLLSVMAFAFASCNSTEYYPSEHGDRIVVKKIDGKRQWGLEGSEDAGRQVYIPCQYDSLYLYQFPDPQHSFYIAIKDGKQYAFVGAGQPFFNGKNIYSIVPSEEKPKHSGSLYGQIYNEAQTDGGFFFFFKSPGEYVWTIFGPYEGFFKGETGYAYKQNGKWGVKRENLVDTTPNNNTLRKTYKSQHIDIIPAKYDAAIEICGRDACWLVKDGKTWKALSTYDGKPKSLSQSTINMYIKSKIIDYKDFHRRQDWYLQRIGTEEFGHIKYKISYGFY